MVISNSFFILFIEKWGQDPENKVLTDPVNSPYLVDKLERLRHSFPSCRFISIWIFKPDNLGELLTQKNRRYNCTLVQGVKKEA